MLGEQICHNDVIWKGRTGSMSEDEPKYSCISASLNDPSTDKTYDDWSCEYQVCRVLCTTPTLSITPQFLSMFQDVKGTDACAPGSFLNPAGDADSCYRYKSPLHVGETLEFELRSTSVFTEDIVDIQATVDPGIPVGLEFPPGLQVVNGQQVLVPYRPPLGTNTRRVRWKPRPGQQGRSYVASFVGFIPPSEFGGTACPRLLRRIHIEIQVPSYESKWLSTPLPKSLFGNTLIEPYICKKSGVACNGRSEEERVARCAADKYATAETNYCGISSDTCCTVETESTSAAPARDLVFSVAPRQVVEGLVLTCQSTVLAPYTPLIELLNATIASPTGMRVLEGACATGSTCDESSKLGGWEGFGDTTLKVLEVDPTDPASIYRQQLSFAFGFLPQVGIDDGFTKRWCFACTYVPPPHSRKHAHTYTHPRARTHTFTHTHRCTYTHMLGTSPAGTYPVLSSFARSSLPASPPRVCRRVRACAWVSLAREA